jgi:PAS domain S-box-containing protein
VWHLNAPIYERVRAGETVLLEDALFPTARSGVLEDAWFTLSYSPVRDDAGAVAGVLVTVVETTARVRTRGAREAERERLLAAERAARAAAERERARLAEVLGALPAGVALTDGPEHRFVLANAAYHATVGGRDVGGQTPEEAFPDLAGQGFHEAVARVYATGVAEHTPEIVVTFRNPDGEARAVSVDLSLVPVRDAAGAVAGVLSFHVDATERVRAEAERARLAAALDAERERLRAVLLQAPTPMALLVGPEHRLELINDAYRRVSGGRDVTGLTFREAYPELEGQPFFELQDRAYATGEPWAASAVPARYDRLGTGVEDAYFDLRYEPVRDADGRVFALLNYGVDVTEQVRARRQIEALLAESEAARAELEAANARLADANAALRTTTEQLSERTADAERALAALADSEARYRLAAEVAQIGTWTWDLTTDTAAFDARVRATFGIDSDAPAPRLEVLATRVHPEDRDRVAAALAAAADPAGDGRYAAEYRVLQPDGTERWAAVAGLMRFEGTGPARRPVAMLGTAMDVSERKRAEAALTASEARLRLALDVAELGTWTWDLATGAGNLDARGAAIVGLAAGDLADVASAQLAAVHPDDLAPVQAATAAGIARGEPFDLHYRVVASDGCVRHVAARASVVADAEGRPVRLVGTNRDVTAEREATVERARLLAELEAERATLRAMILQTPAPLALLVGPEHRFELVNTAYRRISGGGRDVTGLTPPEAFPELAGSGLYALYDRVYETGEPWNGPETLCRYDRDGTGVIDTWFDLRLEPVRDANGRVFAILNFAVDVTEQVRTRHAVERLLADSERARAEAEAARAALASSEVQFRTLADAIPTLAWTAQADGYIDWYNARWYEYTGTTPEQMAGWGWQSVHDPAELPWVLERWRTGIASGAPVEMTFPLRGADGQFRPFLTRIVPLRDGDGRVVRWVGTNTDVATEREARAAAERAQEAAEAASRAKGEFLAVMSHELRTPLNAIGGYAELIELGIRGPVTDAQRADLARIQQSQRHLLGLINQVLNYTRVDAGAVRYDVADVPVADALGAAEALVLPQARARGLTLVLGDCQPGLVARADREKLQQVLLNLLSNAVKFTEPGGAVRVTCAERDGCVAISVADTGVGIAADKLSSIFEPFVQVDQRLTRPHEGVGLGLAISRELARGMGGDLTTESTPGVGSTFILTLPRA